MMRRSACVCVGLFVMAMVGACQQDASSDEWPFRDRVDSGPGDGPDASEDPDVGPSVPDGGPSQQWIQMSGLYGGEVRFDFRDRLYASRSTAPEVQSARVWHTRGVGQEGWVQGGTAEPIDGSVRGLRWTQTGEFDVVALQKGPSNFEIWRAPTGSDDFSGPLWNQFDRRVRVATTPRRRLLVLNDGELWQKASDSDEFAEITPRASRAGVRDAGSFQGVLFAETRGTREILRRRVGRNSWQPDPVVSEQALGPSEWVDDASGLRALGMSEAREDGDGFTVQIPSSFFGVFTEQSFQSPVGLNRASLVSIDRTLYAMDNAGRLVEIDVSAGDAQVVVDQPIVATQVRPDLFAFDGVIYTTAKTRGKSVVLSWRPGDERWETEPIGEAAARQLYATERGVWAESGALQRWNAEGEKWELPHEAVDEFGGVVEADDALFVEGALTCLYKVGDSAESPWTYAAEWNVVDGPGARECDDEGAIGGFSSAADFRDGYVFGHLAGNVDGMASSGEGGLAYWNEETGEVSRVAEQVFGEESRGVIDVTSVGDAVWFLTGNFDVDEPLTLHRKVAGEPVETQSFRLVEGQEILRTDVSFEAIRGAEGRLFARMEVSEDDGGGSEIRLGVWSNGRFDLLRRAEADSQPFLTREGPVRVVQGRLERWEVDSERWERVGDGLPVGGEQVSDVAAQGGEVFVSLQSGGVWWRSL